MATSCTPVTPVGLAGRNPYSVAKQNAEQLGYPGTAKTYSPSHFDTVQATATLRSNQSTWMNLWGNKLAYKISINYPLQLGFIYKTCCYKLHFHSQLFNQTVPKLWHKTEISIWNFNTKWKVPLSKNPAIKNKRPNYRVILKCRKISIDSLF